MQKKVKLTHTQEKKQLIDIISEGAQMLDSADKVFKAAITNMFKDLKINYLSN